MLAPRALVHMPPERRGPAQCQFRQHALYLRHRLIAIPLQILRRVSPQQVDYAEGGLGLLSGWSGRAGCGP